MAQEDVNKLTSMFMAIWKEKWPSDSMEIVLERLLGDIVEVNYKILEKRLQEYI